MVTSYIIFCNFKNIGKWEIIVKNIFILAFLQIYDEMQNYLYKFFENIRR